MVMGSDIPQIVVELAQHLGTFHIPMEAAQISVDKYRMKCRFREHGVRLPWFELLRSKDDLARAIKEHGYPLVIKPLDRSGARGVFYLREGADWGALYEASRAESFAGQVMVEEFVPGPQLSTETILHRGKAYTVGLADRNYELLEKMAPRIIENGATVPADMDAEAERKVDALIEQAARALGMTDGSVKGDLVLTPDGPLMIEMATRLSGGDFCESLVPLGSGINYVRTALQIALGEEPDLAALEPRWRKYVVNRYFFPKPGRLIAVEGAEEVRRQEWIKKLQFWYRPGDTLPEIRSHADRFGVFLAVADTHAEVLRREAWVYETLKISVDG